MKTVLFVDDQLELCAIHGQYLQRHGYRVLTASDADSGLEAARAQHPDVIFLDYSMPNRSGIDVARELKQDPATSWIPIILMTAMPYGAVGRRARDVGCAAFVSKPCGPKRVLQEVERQTGGCASA